MWRLPRRRKETQAGITRDQAKAIIDAEIARRDWLDFDARDYERVRGKDSATWRCRGFVSGLRGGVMLIEIDARTGELLRATVGGR